MTTQNQQALVNAVEKLNQGDIESYLNILYAPNVTLHFLPPGSPQGHEGGRLYYTGILAGFPDVTLVIDDVLEEGDRLAIRIHVDMTHTGDFNGIPPTGKRVSLSAITMLRFENGKVAERWTEANFMGLMQQLGVIPS